MKERPLRPPVHLPDNARVNALLLVIALLPPGLMLWGWVAWKLGWL